MTIAANRQLVLDEVAQALNRIDEADVAALAEAAMAAHRVFFVGVGRVKLALEAAAKRWSHLGIDCVVVGQITEPALTDADLLIVGSSSGETFVPIRVAEKARSIGARVIQIGSRPDSTLRAHVDHVVRIPVSTRGDSPAAIASSQPMTTLFEQALFLLGDIVALHIIEERHLDLTELWQFHANLE